MEEVEIKVACVCVGIGEGTGEEVERGEEERGANKGTAKGNREQNKNSTHSLLGYTAHADRIQMRYHRKKMQKLGFSTQSRYSHTPRARIT